MYQHQQFHQLKHIIDPNFFIGLRKMVKVFVFVFVFVFVTVSLSSEVMEVDQSEEKLVLQYLGPDSATFPHNISL